MSLRKRMQGPGSVTGKPATGAGFEAPELAKTDFSRWRLKNDRGIQTWHYLESEDECNQWPQTKADKWFLGLDTGIEDVPKATTAIQAAENGLHFYSKLQQDPGNWACEYGGPLFMMPGLVIVLHVTNMPFSEPERIEIIRWLFNVQNIGPRNGGDGGWGLHIEGESSVFGTSLNYTALRLLGVSADDPRMRKARGCLHDLGGALNGPHWAKFWLSVLGVMKWDVVNPVPPELWLLPDWTPISPWRWWIHIRMVMLPMSYIWSKQWVYPKADSDPIVQGLRKELFVQPYEEIVWPEHRNSISFTDNYHPKSWILNFLNWILVIFWIPFFRFQALVSKAERWTWKLIQMEDANSDCANLATVNGPMNTLCCYIEEGPDAYSTKRHRERLPEFLWVAKAGMMILGTNGVQNWDTAFTVQAIYDAGLAAKPKYRQMLTKALEFLEDNQITEHCVGYEGSPAYSDPPTARTGPECGYRHPRRGAWGFSNKLQGYTVSDCTAEALRAVLMLQAMHKSTDATEKLFPDLVPEQRMRWAVDILLTMQNASGGCSSYEVSRGSEKLEYLNAAEVFGRIMVEYDYPECTTSCVTTLYRFNKLFPDYRAADIQRFIVTAVEWIRSNQRADGSWYGSWGICFTYASFFALESLATQGEQYENSDRVRRACAFILDHQNQDGGWGESYKSCTTGRYCEHPDGSQVVNTAWALIALLKGGYPHEEPLARGIRLIMERQQSNGEWLQEGIEGVFNKSCMISYPNYKFIFPIMALGMYSRRFGDAV